MKCIVLLMLLPGCSLITIRYSQKPLDNFMVGCMRGVLIDKRTIPTDQELKDAEERCEAVKPKFKERTEN